MNELKPCPFCGGEASSEWMDGEEQLDLCWVECGKCGASTVFCGQPELAIDAWNTRVERTCKIEDCYFEDERHLHLAMEKDEWFGAFGNCSLCGEYIPVMNYCPNCGAKVVE